MLKQQAALGWNTTQVTSLKHGIEGPDEELLDGRFVRACPDGCGIQGTA